MGLLLSRRSILRTAARSKQLDLLFISRLKSIWERSMLRLLLFASSLLLVLALSCVNESPQAREMIADSTATSANCEFSATGNCEKFDFRWIELFNYPASSKIRRAEIFMDPAAFNESNLRQLFEYLSRVNPDPSDLIVTVKTDWRQLQPTSRHCPGSGRSNMPEPPDKYDYLQATYQRRSWTEYFTYSPGTNVREDEFTKVVIRPLEKEKIDQ